MQHLIHTTGLELPTEGLEDKIQRLAQEAFQSYKLFGALELYKDAHYALHLLIELLDAAKTLFNSPVDKDMETFTALTVKMEKELMFDPIPRTILETIRDKRKLKKGGRRSGMASLKGASESHLERYAQVLMQSANLPADRYHNVIDSLKAYRLFHDRGPTPILSPGKNGTTGLASHLSSSRDAHSAQTGKPNISYRSYRSFPLFKS